MSLMPRRLIRLRALSTTTVVIGLLLVVQSLWDTNWASVIGLGLVVLGCLLRPLGRGVEVIRRRLDAKGVSSLDERALDALEALLYEGRPALGLTIYEAAVSLGYDLSRDEIYAALDALVAVGLVHAEAKHKPQIFYYWPADGNVLAVLENERERRLRFQRPGSRSRISGLAERVMTSV